MINILVVDEHYVREAKDYIYQPGRYDSLLLWYILSCSIITASVMFNSLNAVIDFYYQAIC